MDHFSSHSATDTDELKWFKVIQLPDKIPQIMQDILNLYVLKYVYCNYFFPLYFSA